MFRNPRKRSVTDRFEIMDSREKMKKRYRDHMEALEEERRKIQVFQRELPLCLDLVNQAIENCKQQLCFSGFEEETSMDEGPVLEEFIPLKRSSSEEEGEEEVVEEEESDRINEEIGKKVDWLRSVQLWNQSPDPPPKEDLCEKTSEIDKKIREGAFHIFPKNKIAVSTTATTTTSTTISMAATSSTTGDNGNRRGEEKVKEKDGQLNRKARRYWSPELHRRFLQALQQLGGSHVATPKQIRELMKVDGLTNDEVKSHLQKYRLHTRRPGPSMHNNGNPQPTQFVVVGGIWVPPPEYTNVSTTEGEATTPSAKGIYVPIASSPQPKVALNSQQQQQQKQQSQRSPTNISLSSRADHSIGDDDNDRSNSLASSSSTHTTTASPAF